MSEANGNSRDRAKSAGDGYVLDSPYVAVFNSDCTPAQIATSAQAAGVIAPCIDVPFRFADFGCGRGITLLVLAAAYPQSTFFGLDLNPEHIKEAQGRAENAGFGNVTFICGSFASAEARSIQDLDFAVAHGVYSWVSSDVRQDLLSLLAHAVKADGLVYLSYYTAAGYAQTLPLRKLLGRLYAESRGEPHQRRGRAIELVRQLERHDVPFFQQNPMARSIVQAWDDSLPGYLEHEYFAEHFHLATPTDVAGYMAQESFRFCGDAAHATLPLAGDTQAAIPVWQDQSVLDEIASFSDAVPFRKDVFSRLAPGAGDCTPQFGGDQMFGTVWPKQVMQLMDAWNDTFHEIAEFCIDRPRTWNAIKDQFVTNGETEVQVAARLRRAMSARVLTRYTSELEECPVGDDALFRLSSRMSRDLSADATLRNMPPHLPAASLGGVVPVPPDYFQVIAACEEVDCATAWPDRSALRLMEIEQLSGSAVPESEVRRRAGHAVEMVKNVWAPFLVAAGVLEVR